MEPDPRATVPSRVAVVDTARLPIRRRAVLMDTPGCKAARFAGPASRVETVPFVVGVPDRGDADVVAVGVGGGKRIT